jgi:hypothetical protein
MYGLPVHGCGAVAPTNGGLVTGAGLHALGMAGTPLAGSKDRVAGISMVEGGVLVGNRVGCEDMFCRCFAVTALYALDKQACGQRTARMQHFREGVLPTYRCRGLALLFLCNEMLDR